jgi:hypothetical protein
MILAAKGAAERLSQADIALSALSTGTEKPQPFLQVVLTITRTFSRRIRLRLKQVNLSFDTIASFSAVFQR